MAPIGCVCGKCRAGARRSQERLHHKASREFVVHASRVQSGTTRPSPAAGTAAPQGIPGVCGARASRAIRNHPPIACSRDGCTTRHSGSLWCTRLACNPEPPAHRLQPGRLHHKAFREFVVHASRVQSGTTGPCSCRFSLVVSSTHGNGNPCRRCGPVRGRRV